MKYFRSTTAVYNNIAETFDAAYGYPNEATKTLRALPLASDLPSDGDGNVYLAINEEYLEFVLPGQIVPELLADGVIEEVTEQQYIDVLPTMDL